MGVAGAKISSAGSKNIRKAYSDFIDEEQGRLIRLGVSSKQALKILETLKTSSYEECLDYFRNVEKMSLAEANTFGEKKGSISVTDLKTEKTSILNRLEAFKKSPTYVQALNEQASSSAGTSVSR